MRGNVDPSKSELFNAPQYKGEEQVDYLEGQIYKNGADSDGRESFHDPELVHLSYEEFMDRMRQGRK